MWASKGLLERQEAYMWVGKCNRVYYRATSLSGSCLIEGSREDGARAAVVRWLTDITF